MQKQILTGENARKEIYEGVKIVSDAVVSTLGPMGRNAIISRCMPSQQGMVYYMPFATKDGVTVARNITITDQLKNTGANIIKQAAEKTMVDAGDGTTTTCLLMKVILEKGIELIEKGVNPQELKRSIDVAVKYVVDELKKMATPIGSDNKKIKQIATVSANNDGVIGGLIAEAFEKMGNDGIINIENAKGDKTEIKILDGVSVPKGYESPYFITNQSNGECELLNPFVLLYGKKISKLADIEKLIAQVFELRKMQDGNYMANGNSLLIICEEIDGEALATLAMNSNVIRVCAIAIPETGPLKTEYMEDLATVTGATYIVDEKGTSLKGVTLNQLGKIPKAIISKNETVLVLGEQTNEGLSELLLRLKENLAIAEGEEKETIEKRIAKLTGGIATLYVGGATEIESGEKKDRVDDAIRATKSAIAEGYVVGGGSAFINVAKNIKDKWKENGQSIISYLLFEPLKQICKNAGKDSEDIGMKIYENRNNNFGYNAKEDKIENLIETGIIDPVKVLRCSLENAASAATMILTSETLICDTM